MRRFATSRRKDAAPIWSSTIGKRKNFAHASRPANRAGQLGAPIARVTGQPEVRIFELQDGGPAPVAMKKGVLVFLLYCGVTVALTYPLILQMGSVLPNDAGDPALNTWILWWNTQTMPFSTEWWNAPAFFPAPGVMSFSENLLGLSLISTPLHWLGVGPQTAYNVVFFLTFPLSALGAYLLGYELTKRHDAALIAGLLFGFAPYRIAHLPQIQSLASFPMPFALLGLHRYLRDPRPRWLALFGAGWFLQGICNGYYLLFFSVFVGLWILWFASPWSRPRQFLAVSLAWVIAAIPILPLLLRYRAIHASFGFARDFGTIRDFGADVASLLHATGHLALWGSLDVFRRPEGELFPGLTIVLLVVAGAIFVRDRGHAQVNSWMLVRRVLIVLTVATAVVSASAVDRRSVAPRAVRHSPAVSCESHQAAYVFARPRAAARIDEPGPSARVRQAFGHWLLRGGGIRHVAAQPRAHADADGEPDHVSRAVCVADVSPGLQLAAGASAFLDDGDAVPRRDRRDGVRATD